MSEQKQNIIDAGIALEAIKKSGYRSTATAIGELIDNSIQANARDIDIIVINKMIQNGNRRTNNVHKIAVLDNGEGMSLDVLGSCLKLGFGTRKNATAGLGKFGFGLKGSSVSQANIVKVFSWTSKNEVYMIELNLIKIVEQNLQFFDPPIKTDLPKEITSNFFEQIGDSGTLVVWENLELRFKRSDTLSARLNEELCRIYRHFLDDDDTYGARRFINIKTLQSESGHIDLEPLKANDPLYLLTPNNLPNEYSNQATNELLEIIPLPIDYEDFDGNIKQSNIELRITLAKPEVHRLGGNSAVGYHYGKNTGVSFVRAGREIDFGIFNLMDRSDPTHRWWGIEIRFEPELDEIFELSNNKQHVNGFRGIRDEQVEHIMEEAEDGNLNAKMLLDLNKVLTHQIKKMHSLIKGRGVGTRGGANTDPDPSLDRANNTIDKSNEETGSAKVEQTEEEKHKTLVDINKKDSTTLTDDEASEIAKRESHYKVNIKTDEWPGKLFLDRRVVKNQSIGIINRGTKFHDDFWLYLKNQEDQKGFEALEFVMLALIRAEDELAVDESRMDLLTEYREKWGAWIEKLLREARGT